MCLKKPVLCLKKPTFQRKVTLGVLNVSKGSGRGEGGRGVTDLVHSPKKTKNILAPSLSQVFASDVDIVEIILGWHPQD